MGLRGIMMMMLAVEMMTCMIENALLEIASFT